MMPSTTELTVDRLHTFFYQSCEKCYTVSEIPDSTYRLNFAPRPAFFNEFSSKNNIIQRCPTCKNPMFLNGSNQSIAEQEENVMSYTFSYWHDIVE